MKTVKRILAVLLLIVTVALVGYLIFTGNRLSTLTDTGGVYAQISNI